MKVSIEPAGRVGIGHDRVLLFGLGDVIKLNDMYIIERLNRTQTITALSGALCYGPRWCGCSILMTYMALLRSYIHTIYYLKADFFARLC